jgi:thymidylate kinase
MLHIVEGLNCSGKTTFIEQMVEKSEKNVPLLTPWLNPLRDENFGGFMSRFGKDPYLLGSYITLYKTLLERPFFQKFNYYQDRSFVSGFVYETLEKEPFDAIVSVLKDLRLSIRFAYVDTPVDLCLERFYKRPEARDYLQNKYDLKSFWNKVSSKFNQTFEFLDRNGFEVYKKRMEY